jgi:hypothetical protein
VKIDPGSKKLDYGSLESAVTKDLKGWKKWKPTGGTTTYRGSNQDRDRLEQQFKKAGE